MNNDLNDSLDDLLGGPAAPTSAPRVLPTDAGLVAARAAAESFTETCPKCRGTGKFIGYTGRVFGDCFACKGKGSKTFKTAPQVRQQARQRVAVAKATVVADHQAELAWLSETLQRADRLPEGYATMLRDFHARLSAGRELTDGQMAVVRKGMERSAQWAAERAQKAAQQDAGNVLDVTVVREVLQSRKKFTVALFTFSLAAPTSANPGAIYVKDSGQYIGKITAGASVFRPTRDFDPARMDALREVMANPGEAAKADAARRAEVLAADAARRAAQKAAGQEPDDEIEVPCGCCGILLTNPESRARGIGPICAGKWGF